jgi:hypothetical protein
VDETRGHAAAFLLSDGSKVLIVRDEDFPAAENEGVDRKCAGAEEGDRNRVCHDQQRGNLIEEQARSWGREPEQRNTHTEYDAGERSDKPDEHGRAAGNRETGNDAGAECVSGDRNEVDSALRRRCDAHNDAQKKKSEARPAVWKC